MIDTVESFITSRCSSERLAVYRDCLAALDDFEVDGFEGDALNAISCVEAYGSDSVMDILHQTFESYFLQILQAHDLAVREDAELEVMLSVCGIILAAQDHLDHDQIIRITETDETPIEKFALLGELVSGISVERTYQDVARVSEALLTRLQLHHMKVTEESSEMEAAHPALIGQLRVGRDFIQYSDAVGFKMIRKLYPLGAPLAFYLNFIKRHIAHFDDEATSKELFVVLLMASDTYQSPLKGYRAISADLFDDLMRVTKVDIRLTKLFQDFESFRAQIAKH